MRRDHVASTLIRCHFDDVCLLGCMFASYYNKNVHYYSLCVCGCVCGGGGGGGGGEGGGRGRGGMGARLGLFNIHVHHSCHIPSMNRNEHRISDYTSSNELNVNCTQWTTKALIRLCGCIGWSCPSLSTCAPFKRLTTFVPAWCCFAVHHENMPI